MLVLNLLGGPGSGKSTAAYGVVYELKRRGINADFVPEYARELVYDGKWAELASQSAVLDGQYLRLNRLRGHVDVAVQDCALLLTLVYMTRPDAALEAKTRRLWAEFDNVSFFVRRDNSSPYSMSGRYQTKPEAEALDIRIARMLADEGVAAAEVGALDAVSEILTRLEPSLRAIP